MPRDKGNARHPTGDYAVQPYLYIMYATHQAMFALVLPQNEDRPVEAEMLMRAMVKRVDQAEVYCCPAFEREYTGSVAGERCWISFIGE